MKSAVARPRHSYPLRIQVWKKHQDTLNEAPAHTVSRALALKICAAIPVKLLGPCAMQLMTNESFSSIKDRFRERRQPIPKIKPPRRPEGLLLTYPIKDQCSYA